MWLVKSSGIFSTENTFQIILSVNLARWGSKPIEPITLAVKEGRI